MCVDAARFGSYAHRLRNFWSNLADPGAVQHAAEREQRPPGRWAQSVLDPTATAQAPRYDDKPPFYGCNFVGRALQAFPTLMARLGSYSFREGKQGMVYCTRTGSLRELNPNERERALGYATGSTAAPGVGWRDRHAATGACMDAYCMDALLQLYLREPATPPLVLACMVLAANSPDVIPPPHAVMTEVAEGGAKGEGELWGDAGALH